MLRSTKRDGWLLGCVFFVVFGHQRGHWQSRLFQRFRQAHEMRIRYHILNYITPALRTILLHIDAILLDG